MWFRCGRSDIGSVLPGSVADHRTSEEVRIGGLVKDESNPIGPVGRPMQLDVAHLRHYRRAVGADDLNVVSDLKDTASEAACDYRSAPRDPKRVLDNDLKGFCHQSTYCSGVTAKPSGSVTPVEWFGQYPFGTLSRYCWW